MVAPQGLRLGILQRYGHGKMQQDMPASSISYTWLWSV